MSMPLEAMKCRRLASLLSICTLLPYYSFLHFSSITSLHFFLSSTNLFSYVNCQNGVSFIDYCILIHHLASSIKSVCSFLELWVYNLGTSHQCIFHRMFQRIYIILLPCCVSRLSSTCPQRIVTAIAITWKNLYIRRRCNLRSWSTQSNGWMKKWWISWRLRCWWASPTRTPSRKILRNTSSWTWWRIFQYPSFAPRLLAPPGGSPSRVGSTTSTDHLVSAILIWFYAYTHQK